MVLKYIVKISYLYEISLFFILNDIVFIFISERIIILLFGLKLICLFIIITEI